MAEIALATLGVVLAATTAAHAIKHWSKPSKYEADAVAQQRQELYIYNILISSDRDIEGLMGKKPAPLLQELRALVQMQKELERKTLKAERLPAGFITSVDEEADRVIKKAKKIRDKVPVLFDILCKEPQPVDNLQLPPSRERRSFCKGAILYQRGKITLDRLAGGGLRGDSFNCTHCSLQVGARQVFRLREDRKVLASKDLLPASHLVACKSLWERNAYYRCVICYRHGAEVDFASASALAGHMTLHPEDELVVDEEASTDTFEREITQLLSENGEDPDAVLSPQEAEPEFFTDAEEDHALRNSTPDLGHNQEEFGRTPAPPAPPTPPTPTFKPLVDSPGLEETPRSTRSSNGNWRRYNNVELPENAARRKPDWSSVSNHEHRSELAAGRLTPPVSELETRPKSTPQNFHELESQEARRKHNANVPELPPDTIVGPIPHHMRPVDGILHLEASAAGSRPSSVPTREAPPPPPATSLAVPGSWSGDREEIAPRPRSAQQLPNVMSTDEYENIFRHFGKASDNPSKRRPVPKIPSSTET